jgi:hypothetical protein
MKKLSAILFQILFVLSVQTAQSQGFDAALILGATAAQIDGDGLVGYHKVGLTGGIRASYPLEAKSDLGLELLFSQRGSRSPLSESGALVNSTTLNYLEIPVFYNYKDWYQEEEGYYKVRAEGGLSYGYLFSVVSNNMILEEGLDNFRRNDLSVHLGLSYSINKRISLTGRWTRSFLRLWESPTIPNVEGLISYFLTFRLEYHL